jgi:glycosyltransferase involved in cell wall biosynthesis
MIRVGFCTYVLNKGMSNGTLDGIGQYTKALQKHLYSPPLDQEIALVPFTYGASLAETIGLGRHALNTVWSSMTGQNFLGAQRLGRTVDIIHATDHHIPRCSPTPLVATVMDVIPLSHPQWVRDEFRTLKNTLWKKSLGWADRIITISEYSKSEIVKWTDIPADKISVIPLGVDADWFLQRSEKEVSRVRGKYHLPEDFFISLGTLQPRKNVESTILAHRSLPLTERLKTPLIIVGRAGWKCDTLIKLIDQEPHPGAIRWLNRVPDEDIPALLQIASALVFPSLTEGFGLPVLEAFASNVPVIAGRTSCLPEVAGDAAILVEPMNIDEIAAAMRSVRDDLTLRNQLKHLGLQRAKQFTWDACARSTAEIYRNLAR